MLLGVAEGDLDAPAHRVPGDDPLGGGIVPRGIERLSSPPSSDCLTRHDAQRPVRCREDVGDGIAHAGSVPATIDGHGDPAAASFEHRSGRRQTKTTLAWPATGAFASRRRGVVEACGEQQPTRQGAMTESRVR